MKMTDLNNKRYSRWMRSKAFQRAQRAMVRERERRGFVELQLAKDVEAGVLVVNSKKQLALAGWQRPTKGGKAKLKG